MSYSEFIRTSKDRYLASLALAEQKRVSRAPDEVDFKLKAGNIEKVQLFLTVPSKIPFSNWDVLFNSFSILLYIFDIGFDIWLAQRHHLIRVEHPLDFWFTLTFIILSWILTCCYSTWWYYWEYKEKITNPTHSAHFKDKNWKKYYAIRMLIGLLFGPCVRYVDTIRYGQQGRAKGNTSERRQYLYEQMQYERADAALLSLFEAFSESAPQAMLQFFILLRTGLPESDWSKFVTISSVSISCISLAWTIVSYHKALRLSRPDREKLSALGLVMTFLWRLFEVGPRVVALAMLMSLMIQLSKEWVLALTIPIHWLLMVLWVKTFRTSFCERKCCEWFFVFVMAIVWMFCFFNVKDGHTRRTMLVFYSLYYVENVTISICWYLNSMDKPYRDVLLPFILGTFVLSMLAMLAYYKWLHPIRNTGNQIKPCLPRLYWCDICERSTANEDDSDEGSPETRALTAVSPTKSDSSSNNKTEAPTNQAAGDSRRASNSLGSRMSMHLDAEDIEMPRYRAPTPTPLSPTDNTSDAENASTDKENTEILIQTPTSKLVRQDTVPRYMAPVAPNNYGATMPGGATRLLEMKISGQKPVDHSQGSTLPGAQISLPTTVNSHRDQHGISPVTVRRSVRTPVPQPRESMVPTQEMPSTCSTPELNKKADTKDVEISPQTSDFMSPELLTVTVNDGDASEIDTPMKTQSPSSASKPVLPLVLLSPDTPMKQSNNDNAESSTIC